MAVLRLFKKTNDETIHCLEWMLQEARLGKLTDFFGGFRENGVEHVARTGLYRAHSSKALRTLVRMQAEIAFEDSRFEP